MRAERWPKFLISSRYPRNSRARNLLTDITTNAHILGGPRFGELRVANTDMFVNTDTPLHATMLLISYNETFARASS